MTLFLGIDGGGSKTEALIAAEDGRIYGWQKTGPSNPLFMPPAKALENVVAAVEGAMTAQTAIMKQAITQACICIPGFEKQFFKRESGAILGVGIEQISMMGDEREHAAGGIGCKSRDRDRRRNGFIAIGRDGRTI
jgi:N-acetylglucosamine kinase-like BadF-type ATPase